MVNYRAIHNGTLYPAQIMDMENIDNDNEYLLDIMSTSRWKEWINERDIRKLTADNLQLHQQQMKDMQNQIKVKVDSIQNKKIQIHREMEPQQILSKLKSALPKDIKLSKIQEIHDSWMLKHGINMNGKKLSKYNSKEMFEFVAVEFCAEFGNNSRCQALDPTDRCIECGLYYHTECVRSYHGYDHFICKKCDR